MTMNKSTWAVIGSMLLLVMMGQVSSRPDIVMRAGGPAVGGGVPPEQRPSIYKVEQDVGMNEEILGQEEGKALDGLKVDELAKDAEGPDILKEHQGVAEPAVHSRIRDEQWNEDLPDPKEPGDTAAHEGIPKPKSEGIPDKEPADTFAEEGPGDDWISPDLRPDPNHPYLHQDVPSTGSTPNVTTSAPDNKILGMSVPVFVVVIILIIIFVILLAFGIWYMIRQRKKKAMKDAGANAEVTSVTPITTADGTKAQIVKIEPISEGGSSGSPPP